MLYIFYIEINESLPIEYYKELCPNIVYIEPCNEPQSSPFGGLTIDEVVSLYVTIGKIVKELNKKHNYEKPLKFGGYAPACGYELIDSWELFLEKLARVKKSERVIDYYSFHVYSTNLLEVELYVLRHNQKIKELGLPSKPIFVDELGFWYDSPEISANLKNESFARVAISAFASELNPTVEELLDIKTIIFNI